MTEFNLSPFKPKKDQCAFCCTWESLSNEEKQKKLHEKEMHDKHRELSQKCKQQISV